MPCRKVRTLLHPQPFTCQLCQTTNAITLRKSAQPLLDEGKGFYSIASSVGQKASPALSFEAAGFLDLVFNLARELGPGGHIPGSQQINQFKEKDSWSIGLLVDVYTSELGALYMGDPS